MTRLSILRKLAVQIKGPQERASSWRNCVIDHVTPGASADGIYAVFLRRGSDVFPAPYLASFAASTAAPGDMVRVHFDDGSPMIHGQVVGLPNLN